MKSTINLFDTAFILHSDEENDYIQSLVRYIESRVKSIQDDIEVDDPMRTAILTLILISHELRAMTEELHATNNFAINSVKKLQSLLEQSSTKPTHATQNQNIAQYSNHTGEILDT